MQVTPSVQDGSDRRTSPFCNDNYIRRYRIKSTIVPSSVALVVLDTLRKDVFDEHFDWLSGLSFNNAYSTSHWTTPAHASMFAGAYPSELGVHAKHLTLDTPNRTIAEKLQDGGWTCRGYSANGNVSQSTHFDRGFDEFTAKGYHSEADIFDWQGFISEHSNEGWSRYIRAVFKCVTDDCDTIPSIQRGIRRKYDDLRYDGSPNLTVEDALEYVTETPFGDQEFLFLNLMEAHSGYTPPETYQTVEPPNLSSIDALEAVLSFNQTNVDEDRFKQAYQDSVRYLSEYYQKIHDTLLEDFEYIITVSDHGEAFGEQGIYGHVPSLIPSLVKVPLVISGNVQNEISSATVSILDVHQTIASLTGVTEAQRGQDLLLPDSQKYITESHGLSRWQKLELHNRGFTDDDFERVDCTRRGIAIDDYYGYDSISSGWNDVNGSRSDAETELNNIVSTFVEPQQDKGTTSEEVRAQLRDMGYI